MRAISRVVGSACFCLIQVIAGAQSRSAKPVQVMIVGRFHMSNPGHDVHNVHVEDVLTPNRQTAYIPRKCAEPVSTNKSSSGVAEGTRRGTVP